MQLWHFINCEGDFRIEDQRNGKLSVPRRLLKNALVDICRQSERNKTGIPDSSVRLEGLSGLFK